MGVGRFTGRGACEGRCDEGSAAASLKLRARHKVAAGYSRCMIWRLAVLVFAWAIVSVRAAAPDVPFYQDRSEQFPAEGELAGATMKKVHVNKDGIVYVLTDRGMARLFGNRLALDRSFRPLIGKKVYDSWVEDGEIVYSLNGEIVCNGFAGTRTITTGKIEIRGEIDCAFPDKGTKFPMTNYTAFKNGWFGSSRGVFSSRGYYASQRWLLDDQVVDLETATDGSVFVLTKKGLNRIVFEPMTLERKAMHYEEKIRKRHIRYGFCSELRLSRPGDPSSAEMIDTDNDGTWSEYYLASQAFRFGATGDAKAHANAWETFAAMERLESINSLGGFPARTFERKGYKVSDPDRWRDAGDGLWEWKGHTSSDEIIAHMFGSSVLWECAAKTKEEKGRIVTFVTKIADHILRNNLYLIDVDGKPTLWGRWNPEYVNWFPHSIVDRRLNSAEIIGLLQFAYRISGDEKYKARAMELFEKHGYLENILWPMKDVALTKGFIHQGNDMGDEWNHSDDLLSFDAYWVLYHYAFNGELKKKYAAAIRDHWEMEKEEKNPLFAFVYASTKPKEFDLEGALWTLRRFPWDMVDWTVQNSHRQDITKLPENFRHQELKELLPPGERRITRWNSHPFVLDGGSGGQIELAGDEYLLPYWMGRYLKIIAPPERESKRQPVWP
jgi:hypothetical protein